jgi:hypothetical protein
MNSNYHWEAIMHERHNDLRRMMEMEIETMREILANMHQEEVSLVQKDKTAWSHVIQERSNLMEKLGDLREKRLSTTEDLKKIFFPQGNTETITFEEIIPCQGEESCDLLILRDQITALIDRLHLQHSRNEALFYLSNAELETSPAPKKQKNRIATLPPEEL